VHKLGNQMLPTKMVTFYRQDAGIANLQLLRGRFWGFTCRGDTFWLRQFANPFPIFMGSNSATFGL